jgi:hypothetical protein
MAKDTGKAKAAAANASGKELTTIDSPFGKLLDGGEMSPESDAATPSDSQPNLRYQPLLNDQQTSADQASQKDAPVAVAAKPAGLRKIEVPSSRRQLR